MHGLTFNFDSFSPCYVLSSGIQRHHLVILITTLNVGVGDIFSFNFLHFSKPQANQFRALAEIVKIGVVKQEAFKTFVKGDRACRVDNFWLCNVFHFVNLLQDCQ